MNVLITGVLGMVGSHMLDFLLEKPNIKIYGFCRWNDSMDNIEHLTKSEYVFSCVVRFGSTRFPFISNAKIGLANMVVGFSGDIFLSKYVISL